MKRMPLPAIAAYAAALGGALTLALAAFSTASASSGSGRNCTDASELIAYQQGTAQPDIEQHDSYVSTGDDRADSSTQVTANVLPPLCPDVHQ
jgi:hypothetical protein